MTEALVIDGSSELLGVVKENIPVVFEEWGIKMRHGEGRASDVIITTREGKRIEVPCGEVRVIEVGDLINGQTMIVTHLPLERIDLK